LVNIEKLINFQGKMYIASNKIRQNSTSIAALVLVMPDFFFLTAVLYVQY
jgi:hypothetical protein